MYIVHPNHRPRQITRTDHDAWTISLIDFRRGPFLDPVFDGSTLTASARTGTVVIESSEADFFKDGFSVSSGGDVTRLIKLHHGYAKISRFLDVIEYTGKSGTFTPGETIQITQGGGLPNITSTLLEDNTTGTSLRVYNISASFAATGLLITGLTSGATATTDGNLTFGTSNVVQASVQENENLELELEPSMTATTISFHEGDPDATGLAHNDFIEDSAGNFITEGFEVGMRISASGSANIDISSLSVSGSKITVTSDGPHNLINGDLIKLTGRS